MISKLCIVHEEADETVFWLETLKESGILDNESSRELHRATEEVLRTTVASLKTLKFNKP